MIIVLVPYCIYCSWHLTDKANFCFNSDTSLAKEHTMGSRGFDSLQSLDQIFYLAPLNQAVTKSPCLLHYQMTNPGKKSENNPMILLV